MKIQLRYFVSVLSMFTLATGLMGAEKDLKPDARTESVNTESKLFVINLKVSI